ncbi:hypothetical protein DRF65_04880 [Chryseobacterium pennae]|uniref:Uncharacterized protein n=1 Tax=Chryseobacterium pennae TaxID=2258962 RepID=A0A3D9CC57_9FLAO|nr:hypothetical protein [Chryseobacterium pennae]REC63435.1 hypothetical protein DRF65_04880 [Chryseobacterium pennae]
MENIGEFSADGYGMAIISTDLFTEYLKEKKCRGKKLLSYFDKHKELFLSSIKEGRFLPFYQISVFEYTIFISVDEESVELPQGYDEVFRYNNFFLEVGDLGRICFASFDYLEYRLENIKQNITDKEDQIPTGADGHIESYFPAKGFDLSKGIYEFDLVGLERTEKLERESKNYAYVFIFRSNEKADNHNFEKADNDTHSFDIPGYKTQLNTKNEYK